jgi:hypothetical protein
VNDVFGDGMEENKPRISYESWNDLIFNYLFGEHRKGSDVSFSIEKSDLAAMSGLDPIAAEESFRTSVLSLISKNWRVGQVKWEVNRWSRKSPSERGIYPAVAFLALTVLAASKMGDEEWTEHGFNTSNFYVPLRKTLVPTDIGEGSPGDYTEHIQDLWDGFANWVNNELRGEFGRLTVVAPPPERRYVELATQHAVLRASDRRRLDDFFEDLELQINQFEISEIKRHLRTWCNRKTENWAKRIQRVLEDQNFQQYIDSVLEIEVREYLDDSRTDSSGFVAGRIRLVLGFDAINFSPELSLILEANQRHPAKISGIDEIQFNKSPNAKFVRKRGAEQ